MPPSGSGTGATVGPMQRPAASPPAAAWASVSTRGRSFCPARCWRRSGRPRLRGSRVRRTIELKSAQALSVGSASVKTPACAPTAVCQQGRSLLGCALHAKCAAASDPLRLRICQPAVRTVHRVAFTQNASLTNRSARPAPNAPVDLLSSSMWCSCHASHRPRPFCDTLSAWMRPRDGVSSVKSSRMPRSNAAAGRTKQWIDVRHEFRREEGWFEGMVGTCRLFLADACTR